MHLGLTTFNIIIQLNFLLPQVQKEYLLYYCDPSTVLVELIELYRSSPVKLTGKSEL